MKLECFPEEVTNCQMVCALRFEGYRYLDDINQHLPRESHLEFRHLADPIVQKLELHQEQNHNFAAFFALQRYLGKWGGERLTKYSAEHAAFDFLFLALYRLDPPQEYLDQHYDEKWRFQELPQVENHAGFVRRSFSRRGEGSEVHG